MSKHKNTSHKYTNFKSTACFIPKLKDQADEAIVKINTVILSLFLPFPWRKHFVQFTHKLVQTQLYFESLNSAKTPAYASLDLREILCETHILTNCRQTFSFWEMTWRYHSQMDRSHFTSATASCQKQKMSLTLSSQDVKVRPEWFCIFEARPVEKSLARQH